MKRGVECSYKTPGRLGRTPRHRKETIVKPVATSSSSSSESIEEEAPHVGIKHLGTSQVLDMFYEILCCFPDIVPISRPELEQYLNGLQKGEHSPSHELNSLLFSIRALCEQREGMHEAAEESVALTLSALSPIFDNITSFRTVSSYIYLSMYESGCGRMKSARHYLTFVKFYMQELEQENNEEKYGELRELRRVFGMLELHCTFGENILVEFKLWPSAFEKYVGMPLPNELKELLSQDIDQNNYKSFLKIVDLIAQFSSVCSHSQSEFQLKVHEFSFPIVLNGLRLEVLKKSGQEQAQAERCAMFITNCTEHELFSLCPPLLIIFMVSAATLHLEIIKSIERGERINPVRMLTYNPEGEATSVFIDYYSVIQKDQRALQLMNSKFKKVELFHGELLRELTNIVHERLRDQLNVLKGKVNGF